MYRQFFSTPYTFILSFWNNWKAVLWVYLCVLGSLWIWNTLLTNNVKISNKYNPIIINTLEENLQTLSNAAKILHAQKVRRPLGIILGASMLSYNLDHTLLTENDKLNWDWLLLGGEGCGIPCYKAIEHSLDTYSLYPDLVLFMYHPFQFYNYDAHPKRKHMIQRKPPNKLEKKFWPNHYREQVLAMIKNYMLKLQLSLEPLGFSFPGTKSLAESFQSINHWTPPTGVDPEKHQRLLKPEQKLKILRASYSRWQQYGFFTPDAYQLTPKIINRLQIFRNVSTFYTHKGAKAFILLSPLHSITRQSFPVSAYQNIQDLFESRNPEKHIPIIDMTNSIPDELMRESSHANYLGQQHFSLDMAKMLNRLIQSKYREFPSLNMANIKIRPKITDEDRQLYFISPQNHQRMMDLKILQVALQNYHKTYHHYPKSTGFSGLYSDWGDSGNNWIPGLVPEFLAKLPRDPRENKIANQQYLYRSNGKDYKLLALAPEKCKQAQGIYPDLVDPRRGCRALSLWSEKASNW